MTQLTRDELEKAIKYASGLDRNVNLGVELFLKYCRLAIKGLEADKLAKDRDALLVALKKIRDDIAFELTDQARRCNLQDIARAAIAAAEAKA